MATHADVIADDLEVITERLQPFAPHEQTRQKLHDLYEEYTAKVERMEELFDGRRLSCPLHQDNEAVIITGNGRNGTKKFKCRQHHDPEQTGRDTTDFRFSTFTSFEAYQVYQDFLVEALTLLTTCEGTYAGIAEYLHLSEHMVEYGAATLLDYLDEEASSQEHFDIDEDDDEDLLVVYADFSSTRVSKELSIIMGRIDDEICYYPCPSMNWLTAWSFVKAIDESIGDTDATVVFVTDGEVSLVEPIRAFFPNAVHVRQFHSANTRGIIYTHVPVDDQLYTVRCRWDAVLDAGTPSANAARMRRWRHTNETSPPNERSNSDSWTDLSDAIYVWEGVVKYPRGTRQKESSTNSADRDDERVPEPADGDEPSEAAGPGATEAEATASSGAESAPGASAAGPDENGNQEHPDAADDSAGASGTDGADRLFRGSLDEAQEYTAVGQAFDVLGEVFGGHFITSNPAEALFHLKPALRAHRTVKTGEAFIRLFLFLRTQVKDRSRAERRAFFREEVVTGDRLRRVAVNRTGPARSSPDPAEVVVEAHREGEPVVISYSDQFDRTTRRMIEPLSIEVDEYSGATRVESFCYLRQAERTFLTDRITEAIPVDSDLAIVPADG